MRIYTCNDQIDSMMAAIYSAWEYAITEGGGHENVGLEIEPIYQPELFCEYVHVDADEEKAEKVLRSVKKKISTAAYVNVIYASLYGECSRNRKNKESSLSYVGNNKLQIIYDYMRKGFKYGSKADSMLTDPDIMRIMELRRRVGNESHYFREFARFTSLENKVYICHLEPKSDVISLVGMHFADRMPSENWLIIDDNRKTAVVHPKDEENYIKYLTEDEYNALSRTEDYEDEYTSLWRTFFNSVCIKERKNKGLQTNMFPVWMRKHAVEFM